MSRSSIQRGMGGQRGPSYLAQKIEEKNRMKDSVTAHRTGFPERLLRWFDARPPLPFEAPIERQHPTLPYTGIAQYVEHFAKPGDPEYEPPAPETRPAEPRLFVNPELSLQVRTDAQTKLERDVSKKEQVVKQRHEALEEQITSWDPSKDPNIQGDPFKTIFVTRLSQDVSERKLRREFEEFGPIKRIRLVHDKNNGTPKGYAFIEFEHKNDMKQAYKMADGRKIEGVRCLVDVERGRTVPKWKPKRLGGGKGGGGGGNKGQKTLKRHMKIWYNNLLEKILDSRKQPERRTTDDDRGDDDRDRDGRKSRDRSQEGGGRDRVRERSRDRSRGKSRDHNRERGSSRRDRDRSDRGRSDRDYSRRDRDRGERGDSRRDRDRSDRDRDDYRRSDRGGRDDHEPEEGEVDAEEGEYIPLDAAAAAPDGGEGNDNMKSYGREKERDDRKRDRSSKEEEDDGGEDRSTKRPRDLE